MIMTSLEFRESLRQALSTAERQVVVVSAFVTSTAIDWLAESLVYSPNVAVVARWQPRDLQSGASDFESYWRACQHGYRFYVDTNMHTKAFMIDREKIFIGSANFTASGLWLERSGNDEMATVILPDVRDVGKLDVVVRQATELTDEIVEAMEREVSLDTESPLVWPKDIQAKLVGRIEGLWVADLPMCSPDVIMEGSRPRSAEMLSTLSLLGLSESGYDSILLRSAFRTLKVHAWLMQVLEVRGSVRFGALASALHSVLLEDPSPYRRDVKTLVSLLFDWMLFIEDPAVEIAQHRHTRSISLLQG